MSKRYRESSPTHPSSSSCSGRGAMRGQPLLPLSKVSSPTIAGITGSPLLSSQEGVLVAPYTDSLKTLTCSGQILPHSQPHSSNSGSSPSRAKEMPLGFLKRRGSKRPELGMDTSSLGSRASVHDGGEGVECVYEVKKVKDLPKLHRAVWKKDINKVKAITNGSKASVLNAYDKEKRTCLHLACALGLGDIVLHLCATSKADPNVLDADGAAPTHRILECGHTSPLQYLLDCGANPNLSDRNGRTPLHVASRHGDIWAVSLLLEREAHIDAIDQSGYTALHVASLYGHQQLVSALINDGADINRQDGEGKTCLMIACSEGRIGLVQILVDNGADFDLKDRTSFRAIDYAITRNHHDCVRILETSAEIEKNRVVVTTPSRSGSLVDHALIHSSYGMGVAGSVHLDGGPAMGCPESPAHSEYTPSISEPHLHDDSWAASDTEEIPQQVKKPSLTRGGVASLLVTPPHDDSLSGNDGDMSEDIQFPSHLPAPSPAHSTEERKEEVKVEAEVFPLPEFSDEGEGGVVSDFDSDISDLLAGGYIPSSADDQERGTFPAAPLVEVATARDQLVQEALGEEEEEEEEEEEGGASGQDSRRVVSQDIAGLQENRGVAEGPLQRELNFSDFDSSSPSVSELLQSSHYSLSHKLSQPLSNIDHTHILTLTTKQASPSPVHSNVPSPTHFSDNPSPAHLNSDSSPAHFTDDPSPDHLTDSPTHLHLNNDPSPAHLESEPSPTHLTDDPTPAHLTDSPTQDLSKDQTRHANLLVMASPTHLFDVVAPTHVSTPTKDRLGMFGMEEEACDSHHLNGESPTPSHLTSNSPTPHHMISDPPMPHHMTSDPFKPHHITSDPFKPHHITSDPFKPHHITSDPFKPHHMTSEPQHMATEDGGGATPPLVGGVDMFSGKLFLGSPLHDNPGSPHHDNPGSPHLGNSSSPRHGNPGSPHLGNSSSPRHGNPGSPHHGNPGFDTSEDYSSPPSSTHPTSPSSPQRSHPHSGQPRPPQHHHPMGLLYPVHGDHSPSLSMSTIKSRDVLVRDTSLTPSSASLKPHPEGVVTPDLPMSDADTEDWSQERRQLIQDAYQKSELYQKRAGHLSMRTSQLEQELVEVELQCRELQCGAAQAKEEARLHDATNTQLREHLDKMEERLGGEVEALQKAEFKGRDLEVAMRALKLTNQKLLDEGEGLRNQLHAEKEARSLQEGIYHEQVRVFQGLKSESEKTHTQHSELQSQLEGAESDKISYESQIRALASENGRLKQEVATLKQRGDEMEAEWEGEVDAMKAQFHEVKDHGLIAETTLLETQQAFEVNLQELQKKAEMLTSALDKEVESKSHALGEAAVLRTKLEQVSQNHTYLQTTATDREKKLSQQLEEAIRDGAIKDCNLNNTRETIAKQKTRLDSLDAKLAQSEASLKASETLAMERAHEISTLARDHKEMSQRLAVMEVANQNREEKTREVEGRCDSHQERITSLNLEKERLSQQVQFSQRQLDEREQSLVQVQTKLDSLSQSAHDDQVKIGSLETMLAEQQVERKALEDKVGRVREELQKSNNALRVMEEERKKLLSEKAELEGEVHALKHREAAVTSEREGEERERLKLTREVQHLAEVRATLEGLMSGAQVQVDSMKVEMDKAVTAQQKAVAEAEEVRSLWEAEVKIKSLTGQKLVELDNELKERKKDSDSLVANEKRRTRKALEMKRVVEERLGSLQVQHGQAQGELTLLRSQVKSTKHKVRQLQQKEGVASDIKAGQEHERASLQNEVKQLKILLQSTREQLKKEGEAKIKEKTKNKQDLDLSLTRLSQEQQEAAAHVRECRKLDRANKRLREEVRELRQHMAENTLPRAEVEEYKKEVDEKARRDLIKKLEEVNAHMDQQAQAQEALVTLRDSQESEWRSKFEHAREEVRQLRSELVEDKESSNMEVTRLKELHNYEVQRSAKLSSRLQKFKDEAVEYKTKYSLEHNRTQKLLNGGSQMFPISCLSPPVEHHLPQHTIPTTSTPKIGGHVTTMKDHSQTEELLSHVRSQLDSSIARHLDHSSRVSSRTIVGKATRSTYNPLDSISRNYHI